MTAGKEMLSRNLELLRQAQEWPIHAKTVDHNEDLACLGLGITCVHSPYMEVDQATIVGLCNYIKTALEIAFYLGYQVGQRERGEDLSLWEEQL